MRRRFFLGVESLGQRLTLDGSIGIAAALPNAPPADVAPVSYGMINPIMSPTDDGPTQLDPSIPAPCDPMDPNWSMIREKVIPLYDPMRI